MKHKVKARISFNKHDTPPIIRETAKMEDPHTEHNPTNTTNSILLRPKTGYDQHTNPKTPNTTPIINVLIRMKNNDKKESSSGLSAKPLSSSARTQTYTIPNL